ncbi:unnamed protein product [Pieris macdunnoughi]|uniref:Protein CASC3 n=1 Tax=Pieris macdunnoughi TaxID=345717 RepID=A0A821TCL2_9NEOP|nr:unnamed protein product [Pieris macdunnoughi]
MTSVARRREQDDSGEYSDASQEIEQNNSGNDAAQQSDYDSQGSDAEHSDRDPEAQESEKRVDDDEDRSNPQYIPKRGTFYEHDDRTAASGEESSNTTSETASEKKEGSEPAAERRRAPRKSETVNKWSHDKFNENEQMPKSRDELVSIYGYDIRNEDAPPHARRNRRYGRGPNKYTRTWEDEEAYKRQAMQAAHKKPPSPSDFPELNAVNKPGRKPRVPRPRSKSQPASNDSSENGSLRRNASIKAKSRPNPVAKANPSNKEKMPPLENLTITTVINNNQNSQPLRKVNATIGQQAPVSTDLAKRKPVPTQNAQSNATKQSQQKPAQNQQGTGEKFYFVVETQLRNANANQQGHGPSPPHQPVPNQPLAQQQVRLGLMEQQPMVPHAHHAMHNMPQPHNIGQIQAPQAYAPPAMMPAQYMQQSGSGAVYGGAMYQPPQYPPHQMYPHHNYPAPAGLTYYTCAEQEQPPRPQRRPTAAIPIVRPAIPERPPNSEKDNIDRIVENMFVRKPWPATHDAKDKEKSQEPQSKDSSQPNSLTSSSISTDSKTEEKKEIVQEPKEIIQESKEIIQESKEIIQEPKVIQEVQKEVIPTDSQKESQEETERETEA